METHAPSAKNRIETRETHPQLHLGLPLTDSLKANNRRVKKPNPARQRLAISRDDSKTIQVRPSASPGTILTQR